MTKKNRKQRAEKIINELSNVVDLDKMGKYERENGVPEQVISDTVKILHIIVNLNISDVNILAPANKILDKRNRKSWNNLTVGCFLRIG